MASHLRSQKDLTDRAFARRIEEVKRAKSLLEEQLAETTIKVGEMEESIESLEKALLAKQGGSSIDSFSTVFGLFFGPVVASELKK